MQARQNIYTPLWIAAFKGHVEIVEELIKTNPDINYSDNDGLTALHVACRNGHMKIVEALIKAGANVNAETLMRRTPLSFANANLHHSIADILIDHGSSPDLSQGGIYYKFSKYLGFYHILHPNQYKDDEIQKINEEMKKGACIAYTKIRKAMKDNGSETKLKQQTDLISSWNGSLEMLQQNQEVERALHSLLFNVMALRVRTPWTQEHRIYFKDANADLIKWNDSYEEVFNCGFVFKCNELEFLFQALLKPGVTIDITFTKGDSAHIVSVSQQSQNQYELLDSNTSVIEPINVFSLSNLINLLNIAKQAENPNYIGLILKIQKISPSLEEKIYYSQIKNKFFDLISTRHLNNEINLKDEHGLTSLFYAIWTSDVGTVIKLIDNNATLHTGNEHVPFLFLAVKIGNYEIVAKLLDVGDVNTKFQDETLLHAAAYHCHVELVRLLLTKGAIADYIGHDGVTPLYFACQSGSYDSAEALIDKGANVNHVIPGTGYTPLFIAILCGHTAIVKLLIDRGADLNQRAISIAPIGLAIEKGFLDIVIILIEAGEDLSNVDGNNNSALEFARLKGQDKIVSYLETLKNQLTKLSKNPIVFFKNPDRTKEQNDDLRYVFLINPPSSFTS